MLPPCWRGDFMSAPTYCEMGCSILWGIVLSWKVPKDSDTYVHSAPRPHARRRESEVRRAGAGSPALLAPSGRDSAFRGLRAYSSLRPFTKPTSVRNAYRSNRSSMASEPAACSCPLAGGRCGRSRVGVEARMPARGGGIRGQTCRCGEPRPSRSVSEALVLSRPPRTPSLQAVYQTNICP